MSTIDDFANTVRKAVDISRKKGYHLGIRRWFSHDPKQCDALGAIFIATGIYPSQWDDYFKFLSDLILIPYNDLDQFSLGWDQYSTGKGDYYLLGIRLRKELIYNDAVTPKDMEWLEVIEYESYSTEDDTESGEDTQSPDEA
jgi:hypothetical protein